MAERLDEHFVNSGDDRLPKGLVGLVVLIEDGGGNVMGVPEIGDLGAQHDQFLGIFVF